MKTVIQCALFLSLVSAGGWVAAAPTDKPGDIKLAQTSDARCRKDVKDYLDTLRFVRESAGASIGDRVAGGYVTEAQLTQVVDSQGPCAGAQLLRDKRAVR